MSVENRLLAPLAARAACAGAPAPDRVELARRTGEEFEAVFLSSIMENLFAGVGSAPLFGGGQSEGIYRTMLLQEYGKVSARAGGIGIADAVQREILRLQENQK
jgi:peptidoglycan hydrolase FlgJ